MSADGEDRISTFERHCRLMMRVYPAAYRSERGEEIIGTLLETTPEDRAWPLPRDIGGLVIGGLRACAERNRGKTTAAHLRTAVLVGITAYFAYNAAAVPSFLLHTVGELRLGPFDWLQIPGAALAAAIAVIAWVSRRRAIVVILALPAAGAVALTGPWQLSGLAVTQLACLALLIALGGGERPSRGWLWPIGVIFLVMSLPVTFHAQAGLLVACLLSLIVASIALLAIDGRPVIALVVFLTAQQLPAAIAEIASGVIPPASVPILAVCSAVGALAVWRLRRQSADAGRPRRI